MFHLIPFALGVAAGAVALRLLKNDTARLSLDKAQEALREATVSGLDAIEGASARARRRLTAEIAEPPPAPEPVVAPKKKKAAPRRRPRATPKTDGGGGA